MTVPSHSRSRFVPLLLGKRPRVGLLSLLLFTSILPSAAQAADPSTASHDAEMVRPLVLERTILVAKFDPAKMTLPEINNAIGQAFPAAEDAARQANRQAEELTKTVRALRTASGDQPIYATAGIPMSENDRPLFFVAETASDVDQPLLLDHLRIIGPEISARVRDGRLVIVPVKEERIETVLKSLDPVPREGLAPAFEAVASYPIQLLVLPPDYLRRTIRELVPQLPEQLGGGPSEVLTEGVLWAAFGLDPAALRAELVFQSASEAAAQRLTDYLPRLLKSGMLPRDLVEATLGFGRSSNSREFEAWLSLTSSLVNVVREGDRVVLRLEERGTTAAALPLLARAAVKIQDRLRQSDHSDKFKHILLAMHNYHDTYRSFPPAEKFRGDDGKSPLSWRVHLLPFLDEAALFEQFRLDEPWDSPHNLSLLDKMPEIFSSRSAEKPGQTTFLAPFGEDTVFGGDQPTRFQDITDGTSNTAVLVEVKAALAVPWTAPLDYAFDAESPRDGLQVDDDGRFLAGMADGSAQRLRGDASDQMLLRLFRTSDGNLVDWDAIR